MKEQIPRSEKGSTKGKRKKKTAADKRRGIGPGRGRIELIGEENSAQKRKSRGVTVLTLTSYHYY